MKCRIGERTGDFVVGDSSGVMLNPESASRHVEGGRSLSVTEDTAKRVQRRDEV
jgi:hypothetical protein